MLFIPRISRRLRFGEFWLVIKIDFDWFRYIESLKAPYWIDAVYHAPSRKWMAPSRKWCSRPALLCSHQCPYVYFRKKTWKQNGADIKCLNNFQLKVSINESYVDLVIKPYISEYAWNTMCLKWGRNSTFTCLYS